MLECSCCLRCIKSDAQHGFAQSTSLAPDAAAPPARGAESTCSPGVASGRSILWC